MFGKETGRVAVGVVLRVRSRLCCCACLCVWFVVVCGVCVVFVLVDLGHCYRDLAAVVS